MSSLTSGPVLARNTVINFIGQIAPLLVALFSIPYLIGHFGIDRFGVLTLVWVIIGYFSLFDLGLGRALTQMVAERLGTPDEESVPSIVWLCLALMLVLGILGALILGLISHWLIYEVLKVPPALREETRRAFVLLAFSLPFVISTSALRGLLEAKQRFGLLNAVRIPLGIFMYLGPFLVLPFSLSLYHVVWVLVVGRVLAWGVHLLFSFRVFPSLRSRPHLAFSRLVPLVRFGGSITVSNMVSPLMANMDRFIIGALLSVTAVAYYTTPYEIVTKLWIIPGALTGVLFPAFSADYKQDPERTRRLFRLSYKYILIALFPPVLVLVALANEGIQFWLGPEFARQSGRVLQWMAIGVFLNSTALIPFALIQAAGRPVWVALLHLVQLPFYLGALWIMVETHGIEGAALAWLGRIVIDTAVLFWMAERILRTSVSGMAGRVRAILPACLLVLALFCLPVPLAAKALLLGIILPAFSVAAWLGLLGDSERGLVLNRFRRARKPVKGNRYVSEN